MFPVIALIETRCIFAGAYRAHRDYNGDPPPPFPGASTISFAAGEQIEVTDQVNPQWWVVSDPLMCFWLVGLALTLSLRGSFWKEHYFNLR